MSNYKTLLKEKLQSQKFYCIHCGSQSNKFDGVYDHRYHAGVCDPCWQAKKSEGKTCSTFVIDDPKGES